MDLGRSGRLLLDRRQQSVAPVRPQPNVLIAGQRHVRAVRRAARRGTCVVASMQQPLQHTSVLDSSVSSGSSYDRLGMTGYSLGGPLGASGSSLEDVDPARALMNRILSTDSSQYCKDMAIAGTLLDTPGDSAGTLKALPSPDHALDDDQAEACLMVHPGSTCCTVTSVHKDPIMNTVIIHSTTTVRQAPQQPGVPAPPPIGVLELEQLGLMAGATRLQEMAGALGQPAITNPRSVESRHEVLLDGLLKGKILRAEKTTNQFGHVTFKVLLEDPATRQQFHAMVKPCTEGHCDGWHRAEVEAVAYKLNRLLGMDYVPPTVYRHDVDVDWHHYPACAYIYWAEGGRELRCQPMDAWGVPSPVVLSDARILDVLIQNSDRHHGHFLWAEHWAHGHLSSKGGVTWRGGYRPIFIDHAAGFRPEAYVDLKHQNAFNTGETQHISARTYLRLRCLSRRAVETAMGDLLSVGEIDALMHRRDEILAYFDELVAERGIDQVVIEVPPMR